MNSLQLFSLIGLFLLFVIFESIIQLLCNIPLVVEYVQYTSHISNNISHFKHHIILNSHIYPFYTQINTISISYHTMFRICFLFLPSTVYNIQCTLDNTVQYIHYKIYIYTIYSVKCTAYTVHYTLYTLHCTRYSGYPGTRYRDILGYWRNRCMH